MNPLVQAKKLLLPGCLVLSVLTHTVPARAACVPPPAGLVGWWSLDETSGTTANDLFGLHDGTHQNGPAPVAGKVGSGLSLDGSNDFISVPDDPELDVGTGDFSLSAWILPTFDGTIVSKRQSVGGKYRGFVWMVFGSGQLLQIADDVNSWYNMYYPFGTLTNGQWHFVTVTVDRDSPTGCRMYVDGALVYATNPMNRPGNLDNASALNIGRTSDDGFNSIKGTLDEVALYDRALTAGEVQSLYNAGSDGMCKDELPTVFHTVAPCRLIDTRQDLPLTSGVPRLVQIADTCGIPSTARAVAVTLTVANPATAGALTLQPAGQATPEGGTVHFNAGQARAGNAILQLGPGGDLEALATLSGLPNANVDLIVDVSGYFE